MRALLFLILLLTAGCTTTKYRVIHVPLSIPTQCNFEKFTDEEKESITDQVGRKIYRNQQNCIIRQKRINSIIEQHNLSHASKK